MQLLLCSGCRKAGEFNFTVFFCFNLTYVLNLILECSLKPLLSKMIPRLSYEKYLSHPERASSYNFAIKLCNKVCNKVSRHWQLLVLLHTISHSTTVYQLSQFKQPNEAILIIFIYFLMFGCFDNIRP